jgi:hypothetical protein
MSVSCSPAPTAERVLSGGPCQLPPEPARGVSTPSASRPSDHSLSLPSLFRPGNAPELPPSGPSSSRRSVLVSEAFLPCRFAQRSDRAHDFGGLPPPGIAPIQVLPPGSELALLALPLWGLPNRRRRTGFPAPPLTCFTSEQRRTPVPKLHPRVLPSGGRAGPSGRPRPRQPFGHPRLAHRNTPLSPEGEIGASRHPPANPQHPL